MSITKNRTQVLNIYRQLLSLTQEIPIDHLRPKRQFRDELRAHIRQSFKANKDEPINSPKIKALIKDAEIQLEALEALIDNKYHEEFPLSNRLLNPASNPSYYEKLCKDLENTNLDKKPTLKDHLKAFFRK